MCVLRHFCLFFWSFCLSLMLMIFLFIISLIFPISDFLSDFSSIFVFQLFFFNYLPFHLSGPPPRLYFQSFCSFSLSFPSQSLPHRSFSVQVCYRHGRHVLTLLCFACSFLLWIYIFFISLLWPPTPPPPPSPTVCLTLLLSGEETDLVYSSKTLAAMFLSLS